MVIPNNDPAAVDELFGYTGREWDSDVKLQYNRARWYDPAQGRWISQDPIGFGAGDVNLYRYVGNKTTTYTDPSGLTDRYVGDYLVTGKGHHLVPVELWDLFGFSEEVYEIFDDATIATPNGHNFSGHGSVTGYTAQVKAELMTKLEEFIKANGTKSGCLTIEQQKMFAKEFAEHIRSGAGNKFIKGFNAAAARGIDAVKEWYKGYGRNLPLPNLARPLTRVAGIARMGAPKGLSKATAWVKRVPGAKYTLSAIVAAVVYNNAHADGLSVAQAGAIASIEAVNPLPIGPEDLRQVGKWYEECQQGAWQNENGQGSSPNRAMLRKLLEEQAGAFDRNIGGDRWRWNK